MRAYFQWLKGVRRRAAVRSRCWRWVEAAVSAASAKRFGGIAAALATAAILGAAVGAAAKHAGACNAAGGPPPAHLTATYFSPDLDYSRHGPDGEAVTRSKTGSG